MKIEFKKVPTVDKHFEFVMDSVKIEGTFCRIAPSLVRVQSMITGSISVDCCKCGKEYETELHEDLKLILSNGLFQSDREFEEDIIEINGEIIDFEDILNSEIESIRFDYHLCTECLNKDVAVEYEF